MIETTLCELQEGKFSFKVGDGIRCSDYGETFDLEAALKKRGVKAKRHIRLNGKRGYWLEITEVSE